MKETTIVELNIKNGDKDEEFYAHSDFSPLFHLKIGEEIILDEFEEFLTIGALNPINDDLDFVPTIGDIGYYEVKSICHSYEDGKHYKIISLNQV